MSNHPSHFSEPSEAVKDSFDEAFSYAVDETLDDLAASLPKLISQWATSRVDDVKIMAENDDKLVKKFVAELYRRTRG